MAISFWGKYTTAVTKKRYYRALVQIELNFSSSIINCKEAKLTSVHVTFNLALRRRVQLVRLTVKLHKENLYTA